MRALAVVATPDEDAKLAEEATIVSASQLEGEARRHRERSEAEHAAAGAGKLRAGALVGADVCATGWPWRVTLDVVTDRAASPTRESDHLDGVTITRDGVISAVLRAPVEPPCDAKPRDRSNPFYRKGLGRRH